MAQKQPSGCLAGWLAALLKPSSAAGAAIEEPSVALNVDKVLPPPRVMVSKKFISEAEASFLRMLMASGLEQQYLILCQVSIKQLLFLPGKQLTWQNKINSKSIDFLLCDRQTFAPVLGIELDDSSHQKPDRQSRDAEVDQLFAAAGLPLLHVPVKKSYVTHQIVQDIQQKINVR